MRWCLLPLLITIAGCDRNDPAPGDRPADRQPQKIQVLATVYPMAEMVRSIGGEFVNAQWLVEGPHRPEDLDPTAELRQRAAQAPLIVTSGPWDDRWAHASLSEETRSSQVIDPQHM